ncbi:MAG: efflux transporter outer membrane subunit [Acetobacteraceae bacterium]
MRGRRRARLLAALAALSGVAGCSLGPDWSRPDVEVPAAFRASTETADAAWPSDGWWRGFQSPDLNNLIEAARAQNFDIAAAVARVRQADAQVRIAGASLFPVLDADTSAQWQRAGINTSSSRVRSGGSNASFETRTYGAGLNAAYVVDFWGRYRANRQAAVASAMFTRFDQQTVALTVVTSVANTWFTALALADRLAVAQKNLADSEQTLAVVRGRFAAGTASALDVSQQETLVAVERAVLPGLRNQLEQQIIGLGILTGRPPEAITVRPGTLTGLSLPPVSPGLPSALLARRPDIAAAEALLVAANYDIRTARAAFFPTIQLTGNAGFQAAALNALVSPGGALLAAAAGLTAPIFDGGSLRGQLELQKGRYDELLANYRKSVVQAFTDVDNALTAWRYTTEQERRQATAVASARRAATIARAQMEVGTVDITTVLQIESTLFNAEDNLAQVRLARFQALLNLYNSLGGGWIAPTGPIVEQFPGLDPGPVAGGIALPVGGNVQ